MAKLLVLSCMLRRDLFFVFASPSDCLFNCRRGCWLTYNMPHIGASLLGRSSTA